MVVAQNGKRLQFIPFSESIEKLWFKKKKILSGQSCEQYSSLFHANWREK